MPRRFRRAERAAFGLLAAALLSLATALQATPVQAELSGSVSARGLFGIDGRYGGALLADLWGTRGVVRPGAAFGIGALAKGDDASSRIVTPFAFSLAVVPSGDRTGFVGALRLGGYAGAEKGGFIAGGFGAATLGIGIALGEGASLQLGADAWGLLGKRGGAFFGPSIGLGF